VSKENLDEDLRPHRRASPCMRLWALRMPTLWGISQIVNRKSVSKESNGEKEQEVGGHSGPSYFFISLMLGLLISLLWYVPS